MTATREVPEDMTAEKLRFIAKYITECDEIIAGLLRRARELGRDDITDEVLEMVDGKAVQADLRRWAAALAAIRAPFDQPEEPTT